MGIIRWGRLASSSEIGRRGKGWPTGGCVAERGRQFDALGGVVEHGFENVGAFFGEAGAVEGGGEVFVEDFFDFGADARAGLVVVLPILNQDFGDSSRRRWSSDLAARRTFWVSSLVILSFLMRSNSSSSSSVSPSAMWSVDSAWSSLVNWTGSAK